GTLWRISETAVEDRARGDSDPGASKEEARIRRDAAARGADRLLRQRLPAAAAGERHPQAQLRIPRDGSVGALRILGGAGSRRLRSREARIPADADRRPHRVPRVRAEDATAALLTRGAVVSRH